VLLLSPLGVGGCVFDACVHWQAFTFACIYICMHSHSLMLALVFAFMYVPSYFYLHFHTLALGFCIYASSHLCFLPSCSLAHKILHGLRVVL
jgi:hypothetical protein